MATTYDFNVADTSVATSTPTASAGWAYGIQALAPILTTALGVGAKMNDIEARTRASITAIGLQMDSYKTQLSSLGRQSKEIDQALHSSLSQRGIEALKAEGRLRAGAAETGTAGGTTATAVGQAFMDEALDAAIITSQAKQHQISIMSRIDMAEISTRNRISEFASNIPSATGAGLQLVAAGVSSFETGYSMMGEDARSQLFSGDA